MSSSIVWPSAWEQRHRRWQSLYVVFFLAFAALGGLGLISLALGAGARAVLVLAVVPFALLGGMVGYQTRIVSHRLDSSRCSPDELLDGERAVLIPIGRRAKGWSLAFSASAAGALLLAPLMIWRIPATGTYANVRLHSIAWILPIAGGLFLSVLLSWFVRRRKQMGLGLSPSGVYYWTWFGSCFFSWESIHRVRLTPGRDLVVSLEVAEPLSRPDNPEENWVGRLDFFRRSKQKIQAGYLGINPATTYYALGFYHRYPELRHELGTKQGVKRIQQADFPDLLTEVRRSGDFSRAGGGDQPF